MNYLEPRWNLPKCFWTYLIIGTRRKDVSGKLSNKNYSRHTLFGVHLDLNFSFCTYFLTLLPLGRDVSLEFDKSYLITPQNCKKRTLFSQIWAVLGSDYTVFIKKNLVNLSKSKINKTIIDCQLNSLLESCLKIQLHLVPA